MGESDEVDNCETNNCNGILNIENVKDSKTWKRISSISDIQKQSRNWTLAGDAGLLEYLQGFSHQLISKTHEIEKNVDHLIHETKVTSSRVNNIINDFLMLSNTQFIENRVYDEEIQVDNPAPANKQEEQKTKEQREAEIIPQISTALALGLEVIDKAFDQVDIQDSDSEDEEGRTMLGESLLEPKDPYFHRPLPHVIGTDLFHNDDTVGLFDLVSNEAEIERESDEKEYDSGGDSSEESFEKPAAVEKEPLRKETVQDGIPPRFESSSDSDSSDMFGDEAEYISGSADSEEYVKEDKPSDKKTTFPVKNEEPENDVGKDLFGDDVFSPSKDDDKATFLGSSPNKNSLFDDDFEEPPVQTKERLNTGRSVETIPESVNAPEKKINDLKGKQVMIAKDLKALFQSGDDDLFAPKKVLENAKAKAERTKSVSLFDEDDNDDDDDGKLFAEPSTKVSAKPDSLSSILLEQDEFEQSPRVIKSVSTSPDIEASRDSNSTLIEANNLFTEDSHDDLFDVLGKTEKVGSSDIIPSETSIPRDILPEPATAEEKDSVNKIVTKRKPSVLSLFDDDDDEDDLFSLPKESKPKNVSSTQSKARSGSSLFEDDDLFKKDTSDSPDVDLFATTSSLKEDKKKEVLETQQNLRDITSELDKQQPKVPVGGVSLFGNIDIFGKNKPKLSPEKAVLLPEKATVVPEKAVLPSEKTVLLPEKTVKTDIVEDKDEPVLLPKVDDVPKVKSTEQVSVSFDQPVDVSNTLNCAAKGRAKIQTRRRPPTRRGRQTALVQKDDAEESKTSDQTDSIFSDTAKPTPTLVTEQKEMNIDILTSPSTEEDDIFPLSIPATRDIFSTVEPNKDTLLSDSLFSSFEEKKTTNITGTAEPNKDKLLSDSLFSSFEEKKTTNITGTAEPNKDKLLSDSLFSNFEEKKTTNITGDIFDDDDVFSVPVTKPIRNPILSSSPDDIFSEKSSSVFSSFASSKQEHKKQIDIFSDSEEDIFSSQTTVKPTTTVTKKQPSVKQVKRESDIFDDPLLGFSNSDKD